MPLFGSFALLLALVLAMYELVMGAVALRQLSTGSLGRFHPVKLAVNDRPRRQIARHEAPLVARSRDVTKPVKRRPQTVFALSGVLSAQCQIARHIQ